MSEKVNPRVGKDARNVKSTKERKKVIQLRSKGKTWDEIAKQVGINIMTAKKYYNEEMGMSVTMSKPHGNYFQKHLEYMEERYSGVVETTDRLHNMAKKAIDTIEEQDIDDVRTYVKFMKTAPVILQIIREIREQIEGLRKENGEITMEMKKRMPTLSDFNKQLNEAIITLQEQGYIVIKKPLNIDK